MLPSSKVAAQSSLPGDGQTRLSAVVVTRDEEREVGRTIGALSFADEVLVVDAGSTDGTVGICRSLGAHVLQHAFEGFGPQKRWAVSQAAHDWVLCVNAGEVVTAELAAAIRQVLAAGEPPCAAYRFRFLTVFMGRPMSHGSMSRHLQVRLFDRRRAGFTDALVHEQVVADGPVGELSGTVLHYPVRDLSDRVAKMDADSTLGAVDLVRRGERLGGLALVFTPAVEFLRHYLVHQNFRNGIAGLAWSFLSAVGVAMKHLKARELEAAGDTRSRQVLP